MQSLQVLRCVFGTLAYTYKHIHKHVHNKWITLCGCGYFWTSIKLHSCIVIQLPCQTTLRIPHLSNLTLSVNKTIKSSIGDLQHQNVLAVGLNLNFEIHLADTAHRVCKHLSETTEFEGTMGPDDYIGFTCYRLHLVRLQQIESDFTSRDSVLITFEGQHGYLDC